MKTYKIYETSSGYNFEVQASYTHDTLNFLLDFSPSKLIVENNKILAFYKQNDYVYLQNELDLANYVEVIDYEE